MTQVNKDSGSSRRAMLAADHWWSAGMRGITLALLTEVKLNDGSIVELGCGQAAMLRDLADWQRDRQTIGLDVWAEALAAARANYPAANLTQADLQELPLRSASCAAIVALDVYDQRGVDLDRALRETWRVLRPGGILLLRVSAYAWLFGPHDKLFGTGRRYAQAQLATAIKQAGFEMQRLSYANTLLLPPTILLRLLQKRRLLPVRWELTPPLWLNRALRLPLALERHWLRQHQLPAGLSLYALAAKPWLLTSQSSC